MTTEPRTKFFFPIKVRHADTDAQGHVFFANYFTFMDEAATGYLEAIGIPNKKFAELGVDFYYVDAHCEYNSSARSGDLLQVDTRVKRLGNTSFTFECKTYRKDDDQAITIGQVTAVMVNPLTRQPVRVPDEIRQAVEKFEQKN